MYAMVKMNKSLKEHAMKIIKFEKQKMILSTNEEFQ